MGWLRKGTTVCALYELLYYYYVLSIVQSEIKILLLQYIQPLTEIVYDGLEVERGDALSQQYCLYP